MSLIIDGLDSIEILNKKWADDYARGRTWESAILADPIEDLCVFFDHALPGQRMLDVGCGWARYVRHFVEAQLQYTGIDFSEEMIKASKEAQPDLDFQVMSYRSLQFADGAFDALWCCCAFGGEPKRNILNVLHELKRVLRKDGVMMVMVPWVGPSMEGVIEREDGELLWNSEYDLDELEDYLTEAGFEVVESVRRFHMGAQSVLVRK